MIKIWVKEKNNPCDNWQLINDLYWFEENGVHDLSGKGAYTDWEFMVDLIHSENLHMRDHNPEGGFSWQPKNERS